MQCLAELDVGFNRDLYRLLLDWGAETVTGLNSTLSVTTRSMSRRLRESQAADTTLSLGENKTKYKIRELSVKLERLPTPLSGLDKQT